MTSPKKRRRITYPRSGIDPDEYLIRGYIYALHNLKRFKTVEQLSAHVDRIQAGRRRRRLRKAAKGH